MRLYLSRPPIDRPPARPASSFHHERLKPCPGSRDRFIGLVSSMRRSTLETFGTRQNFLGDGSRAQRSPWRSSKIASCRHCSASSSFPRTIPGIRISAMLRWHPTRRKSSPISDPASNRTPTWYADNPANGSAPLYGIPFNVVHGNSTAKINVTIDNYPGESDITPGADPRERRYRGRLSEWTEPERGWLQFRATRRFAPAESGMRRRRHEYRV